MTGVLGISRVICIVLLSLGMCKAFRWSLPSSSPRTKNLRAAGIDSIPMFAPCSLGVPRESVSGEQRVGLTPSTVLALTNRSYNVRVEADAGTGSQYSDAEYEAAGAQIVSRENVWESDLVVKVQPPTLKEAHLIEQRNLVCFLFPDQNAQLVSELERGNISVVAVDVVPKYTEFDALTPQCTLSGRRAVVEGAAVFGRSISAQDISAPAKILVLGAGATGLSAMETAAGVGAEVSIECKVNSSHIFSIHDPADNPNNHQNSSLLQVIGYDARQNTHEEIVSTGAQLVDLADDRVLQSAMALLAQAKRAGRAFPYATEGNSLTEEGRAALDGFRKVGHKLPGGVPDFILNAEVGSPDTIYMTLRMHTVMPLII
jgi:hypothetical protein